MRKFSEKELLLLCNYSYFNSSTKEGTIGDNIDQLKDRQGSFDVTKLYGEGAISCNISEEEAVRLLETIDKDERLRNLHVVRQLEEYDIRGICYVDETDTDACVIFRGTGGTYDAWYDNVTGEYLSDTKLQKVAGDFVKYECSQYKDLVVSGHSKGGNLAQYVTVTCPDNVGSCVSFDGQGFGRDFLKKYKNQIDIAKPKITSVSAYNDYVNILLFGIAGTSLYVKNKGTGIDGHSSFTLFDSISFNENGSINRLNSGLFQGPLSSKLQELTETAVDVIDILPGDGREKATNVLGALVAGYMSNDKGAEYEAKNLNDAINDFKEYGKHLIGICGYKYDGQKICYEKNYYSGKSMVDAASVMGNSSERMIILSDMVDVIKCQKNVNIPADYYTDSALERIIDKMFKLSDKLHQHSDLLRNIFSKYENDEVGICDALGEIY